jgi:hypothetical protein
MRIIKAAPAGALLALMLIAVACGGARKQRMSAPPAAGNADSAAPPSSPRGEIEQLMRSIDRNSQTLGISSGAGTDAGTTTSPRPANPCAAGKSASTCKDVCTLKDSICGNKDRICQIAETQLSGDEWAQQQCTKAKGSCTRATNRCDSCDS